MGFGWLDLCWLMLLVVGIGALWGLYGEFGFRWFCILPGGCYDLVVGLWVIVVGLYCS